MYSLLAHLVPRITDAVEPVATQSLAYILRAESELANELADLARQTGLTGFQIGRISPEETHGEGALQPDLTIRDSDDAVRMFVENKFDAELQDTQPVHYLNALPTDTSSMLLFIVPEKRIRSVWNELKDRCANEEIGLEDEVTATNIVQAQTGVRTLAVTSWRYLLTRLRQAASTGGHVQLEQDIIQLHGLANRMDAEIFLPLRGQELTNSGLARRMINYSDLIKDIVERLKNMGIADTRDTRPTHGYHTAGRYLRLHGRFGVWMGVDLNAWRKYEITPLWWTAYVPGEFSGLGGYSVQEIMHRVPDVHDGDDDSLYIPIRLKAGVERDRVIDDAAAQISNMADRFLEAFPNR